MEMNIIWGMVGNSHDASIAVFNDNKLQEIYTSKNKTHSHDLVNKGFLVNYKWPDLVVWYEKPFKKAIRQLYAGQSRPCLLYTSPSPRDRQKSRMPSSA